MVKTPTINPISAVYGLFNDGFTFIQKRRQILKSDIFRINLMGFKVICFGGEDAARTFYDPDKFMRKGAVPPPVQKTLTGENAIHTKDGAVHRNRKDMFMSLMTPENIAALTDRVHVELINGANRWKTQKSVVLFRESQEVLCRAVCAWAGVPLANTEARQRAKQFVAMVDAFGSVGIRNFRGRIARRQVEKWLMGVIKDVRENRLAAKPGTALFASATHRDTEGQLFDLHMAAVELMNILRPTVAISWYITFGATALNNFPASREKFRQSSNYREYFISELRRYYPFAPYMGAIVKNDFEWNGRSLPKGALVLLDMYGTNHDERLWQNPGKFEPERFKNRQIKPFDFLAQGGGDYYTGHRCPGEWITIEILKTVLAFLIEQVQFTIPQQDLTYSLARMPTYPKSGFIMQSVKLLPQK